MVLPFLGAIKASVIVGRSDLHPAKDCRHHRFGIGVVAKVAADRTSADDKNPHSHVEVPLFSG